MKLLLKNILFTLLVPGTVAVYIPLAIVRRGARFSILLTMIGCLLLILGAAVSLWGLWCFGTIGKGTPTPIDAPKKLVIQGPYRYVRNPMYVGVLLVLLGWAMLFGSIGLLLYTFLVATGFHLFVVFYEERVLEREFGGDYRNYCERVGRWLPHIGAKW